MWKYWINGILDVVREKWVGGWVGGCVGWLEFDQINQFDQIAITLQNIGLRLNALLSEAIGLTRPQHLK